MKHKDEVKLSSKDYENLGRAVESVVVTDYIDSLHSTPRQIYTSFLRGAFTGLGGVIGATVGVAALLFILQHFGAHLPLIGPYLKSLSETIKR